MINIIYPAYDPDTPIFKSALATQVKLWESYSDYVRKNVHIILVDDCSVAPLDPVIDFPLNLTIARITTDKVLNITGAINLGFHIAEGWGIGLSVDHAVNDKNCVKAIEMDKDQRIVYGLKRHYMDGTNKTKPQCGIFMIHSEDYWHAGGYDEDFAGHKGYSDHFIHALLASAGIKRVMCDVDSIVLREFEFCSRKDKKHYNTSYNQGLLQRKLKEIQSGAYNKGDNPRLRFDWHIHKEYTYE